MEEKDSGWLLHIPASMNAHIQCAVLAELIFRIICLIFNCKKIASHIANSICWRNKSEANFITYLGPAFCCANYYVWTLEICIIFFGKPKRQPFNLEFLLTLNIPSNSWATSGSYCGFGVLQGLILKASVASFFFSLQWLYVSNSSLLPFPVTFNLQCDTEFLLSFGWKKCWS